MGNSQEEMAKVKDYVRNYRKEKKIIPKRRKSEHLYLEVGSNYRLLDLICIKTPALSCIAFGEAKNLLAELIYTPEEEGAWKELEDPEIRELVLDEIEKINNKKEMV